MSFYRKIIRIKATDSPNVRLALAEQAIGKTPSNRILVPGVLTWEEYCLRRATWDVIRQTVGLDAEFYEGAELKFFPVEWIQIAHRIAETKRLSIKNTIAVSLDPGEGVANTSMAAVGERGIVELVGKKTPDTSVIEQDFIDFMRKHRVTPERAIIDRGGGGKQVADRLRARGYNVRTVAFGEALALPPKIGTYLPKHRLLIQEAKYAYTNRRAQMYGDLRTLLDPTCNPDGFGIPAFFQELVKQMAPIPLYRDPEGRLIVPPKNPRPAVKSTMKSLSEIIGHSPDELDAVVMAVHAMLYDDQRPKAGVIWNPSQPAVVPVVQ